MSINFPLNILLLEGYKNETKPHVRYMRDDPTCSICNFLNLTALLFISDMAWLHLRFRRLITAISHC